MMAGSDKSKSRSPGKARDALLREMEELRARLEEAEATIEAIQSGGVDALIVSGPDGEKVFALEGADYPYRVIVEIMNEGVVVLSADGAILSCNSCFARFVKMASEHVLGKPLAHFVAEDDAPRLRAFLKKGAEEGGLTDVTLACTDGTAMTVNLSASAFEVGGLPTLCVVFTDVTEIMAATKTRSWLASIVETTNDAIISISLDGVILTWNAAAEYIYGYYAQEVIGQPVSIIVPRDRIQTIRALGDRIRLGEHIRNYETVHITKTGVPLDVALTISPLLDSNGNPAGASVIARDITERRKAQAELEGHRLHLEEMVQQRTRELIEKTDALRANEERLRLALQAGKMGTWDWHIPSGEVIWNDEHYRMLGYEVGAVKPGYEAWISRVYADDLDATEAAFHTAMSEGVEYRNEFRTRMPDRTVHWLLTLGDFRRDASGQAVRSYGVMLDITGQKQAELRIEEMNDVLLKHAAVLDSMNKELESYSHSVSHDLRTPLRFVDRIAHLLLHEPGTHLSKTGTEQVNMILQATGEMAKLIENLLVFSQVSRGPMKKRRMDLRRLFHEAVRELELAREGRDVEIVIQDLVPCRGDRTLLKEVVTNLLANALKFTRRREAARITAGCTHTMDETVYFVQDNGVGFDMRGSGVLFAPFKRLHTSSEFEGNGIGLALVKRIVERHGGRIWAEGEVDKGATFYFTLGKETDEQYTTTVKDPRV